MNILKNLIIGVVALVMAFLVVGFFLPSEFRVERSITIDAPSDKIYAQLVDLRNWKKWGVWFKRDPNMQITYSGEVAQLGMTSSWISEQEGSGEMTILSLEPDKSLTYSLYFPDFDMSSTGEFTLSQVDGQTQVTWADYGDVGSNPINHYFAYMMDSMVGPDFEGGLQNLKVLVEG